MKHLQMTVHMLSCRFRSSPEESLTFWAYAHKIESNTKEVLMKICFPIHEFKELESEINPHFGSSQTFAVFDTETNLLTPIVNQALHEHGSTCNPFAKLGGAEIDALIVGGIGAGALSRLAQAGIRIYRAEAPTVKENISLFQKSMLPIFGMTDTCAGHAGGCEH